MIKEEVASLGEAPEDQKAPTDAPGKEKADTKGTLDVKKIAETLGINPGKFAEAVRAAKSGSRGPGHNSVLADVFVKLMEASPENTVKVMNALKKVEEKK